MPSLSICIPTYNRSGHLLECVQNVLSAAGEYSRQIEIVISDNASTDDTKAKGEELQKKYRFIKYHRNETNVFDKNFFIAAGLAGGDYLWILGDDDRLEENAIEEVFEKIRAGYNIIVINHSIWLNQFSREFKKKVIPIAKDIVFINHNKLLSVLGPRLGFISSVVIKRDVFLKVPSYEYESFLEFGFAFLLSIYIAVLQDCRAYFIAKPLVKQTGNLKGLAINVWYKAFAAGSSRAFEKLGRQGYSYQAVYSAKHLMLRDYIMHDVSYRKRKGESLKGVFRFILPYYKKHWFFWIVIVPALFLPKTLIKIINKAAIRLQT
jgi:abequosyltransferase